jgi:hypothetical protein
MKSKIVGLIFGLLLWVANGAAQTVIQSLTYSSAQPQVIWDPVSITAGPNVTVASGANVTYVAGGTVILQPGFTAAAGSTFFAVGGLVVVNGTVSPGSTGVAVTANLAPAGMIFSGWSIVSGSASFGNAALRTTTLTNISGATVQANYQPISPSNGPPSDVNGNGIPDELEIAAGMLDPNDPENPADPLNSNPAGHANYQSFQYDSNNQVISGPEGGFSPDNEGNTSPSP